MRHLSARHLILPMALLVPLATCEKTTPTGPDVCAYTVSPALATVPAGGGTVMVIVTTTAACQWTATSDRPWVTVATGAGGTGTGTIVLTIAANPDAAQRNATMTAGGQVVVIRQDAAPPTSCSWTLVPTGVAVSDDVTEGAFAVETQATCAWTAVSDDSWITVTSGSAGVGTGTVHYRVNANPDPAARMGTVRAAGQTFTITQAGDPGACQYSVGPVQFDPCMAARTLTATVTTSDACEWTATSEASWIAVTGGQSGSGSGTIVFDVGDNWAPPRTGLVLVRWPTVTAGQNLRVSQAGCFYAVSTPAISMSSVGGTARFDVLQQSDPIVCGGPLQNACLWSASSNAAWITITSSMPRTGDDAVFFTVAQNTGDAARTGIITVRDKTVVITQAGGEPQ
jgi:hypothetical protein